MFKIIVAFVTGFLVLTSLGTGNAAPAKKVGDNIVVNGDFSQVGCDGKIPGWKVSRRGKVKQVDGKPTLVLSGSYASVIQPIPLQPDWQKIRLTMKMRASGIEAGNANWKNGRLAMTFKNAAGKRVGKWPNVFNAKGTTDWVNCDRIYNIPYGATVLDLNPANFGKSGKLEFQNIKIALAKIRKPLADLPAPQGASDIWNNTNSWCKTSETRDRICLNGLWRFMPETANSKKVPAKEKGWGWFKVPGVWPAGKDWDTGAPAQEFLLHEQIKDKTDFNKLDQGWYQREITIPAAWSGKKIVLDFGMVQTHAAVYINGKEVGDILFPGGEVDITSAVLPGQKFILSILLTARPLSKTADVFMAPGRIFKSKAKVRMKGLTGDVYMMTRPETNYITDTHIITSTRKKQITFDSGINGLGDGQFKIIADIMKDGKTVKTFESDLFTNKDLAKGRYQFTGSWSNPLLWDTHTPQHLYTAGISLKKTDNKLVDQQIPFQFGFREFWIDGRDFYLNGKRIHLRALTVNNNCNYADKAALQTTLHTCKTMKELGFNFLITHNYGFTPGKVTYMDALYAATEKTGILASFSLPHGKDYKWKLDDKKQQKRYEKLCSWLIRKIQNNPSIIAYAMNHNATGYYGDQNPLKIDGSYYIEKIKGFSKSKLNVRKQAMLTERIAKQIDPSRPAYHHQSGSLGDMYTLNCYLNWAPRQERSDWLRNWSEKGDKPIFFVEWGLPHIASWSSYRGPLFIWRNVGYQMILDSEFASAFTNQKAFRMTKKKKTIIDRENKLWKKEKPLHWGYHLAWLLKGMEHNYLEIQSWFANDNWPSFRMMGASAMLPWDQQSFWKRVKKTEHQENPNRYKNLQQPGIVPDYLSAGSQAIYDLQEGAYDLTSVGKTFQRWNKEIIGFIGGKKSHPTEKSHIFTPDEIIEKQLVIINDSREDITCKYSWAISSLNAKGNGSISVAPGNVGYVPVVVELANATKPGQYQLSATFDFGKGNRQQDTFKLTVIANPVTYKSGLLSAIGLKSDSNKMKLTGKIALFDPLGQTAKLLEESGIEFTSVKASADLTPYNVLIIGKNALSASDSLIDLASVKHQLNILVFEQSYDILSNRLGLRANIMGLRQTYARNQAHPVMKGISDELLRNWRGSSTLTTPYLQNLPEFETHDPQWNWCGFNNTRVWRCGNVGNAASVLIEKPTRGNWLPLIDGGFNLQYAPLLEYRDDKGIIVFCQMDVTGRTEREPVAVQLCRNLVSYLDKTKPAVARSVYYAGNKQGEKLLNKLAITYALYNGQPLTEHSLLVVGPKANLGKNLTELVKNGGNAVCLGLNSNELKKLIPSGLQVKDSREYSSCIDDFSTPEFAGISNSELFWHVKQPLAAIQNINKYSNKTLKKITSGKGTIILSQVAPWMIDSSNRYLRSSYRRNLFLTSRLLGNLGAASETALRSKFNQPVIQTAYVLPQTWVGIDDPDNNGRKQGWFKVTFNDSTWKPIKVPGAFEDQRKELADYDGYFWYRTKFNVPEKMRNNEITLRLGAVDDESWVWLNGHFLGEITKKTNPKDHYRVDRIYKLKPDQLNLNGENTLVVRVADWFKKGGIMGKPSLNIKQPNLNTYYVQEPVADDDPYRYYRW